MKKFGIDISYWQQNYPYEAAKAEGVEFAILRAGYRTVKDTMFETHYMNAKRLGWGVGAYWYTYATTVKGAEAEARQFLASIQGKQFEYPLYLDLEDPSLQGLDKNLLAEMVRAFGKIIEDAGYYFGVYTNQYWFNKLIDGSELNKEFDWWIAAWNKRKPSGINAGLWQFGGGTNQIRDPKIAGVITDQDYASVDYPTVMRERGLNGFGNTPEPAQKTIEELANEVIAGQWGNGEERINRLTEAGYDYNAVQNRVNELLKPNQLNKGDEVIIKGTGNGSSNGNSNTAYGIGYQREILQVWNGRPYPYQVGRNGVTIGFYKASALRKV